MDTCQDADGQPQTIVQTVTMNDSLRSWLRPEEFRALKAKANDEMTAKMAMFCDMSAPAAVARRGSVVRLDGAERMYAGVPVL